MYLDDFSIDCHKIWKDPSLSLLRVKKEILDPNLLLTGTYIDTGVCTSTAHCQILSSILFHSSNGRRVNVGKKIHLPVDKLKMQNKQFRPMTDWYKFTPSSWYAILVPDNLPPYINEEISQHEHQSTNHFVLLSFPSLFFFLIWI